MNDTAMRACLLPFLLLVPVLRAEAGLEFAKTRLDVKPPENAKRIEVLFPFRNAGRKTVEISKIVPGCSCLVATTDKKSYKPGEKGEVRAIFDIRMFSRPVSKSMQVIAAGRTHVLETNLLIAEILKIEPRVIIWKIGGQQEPKTFRLEVASRNPVNVLKLGCSRDTHFDYRLETIRKGRDYKVHVTPKSLDARVLGALRIDTDYPVPHRSQFIAFLSIRS